MKDILRTEIVQQRRVMADFRIVLQGAVKHICSLKFDGIPQHIMPCFVDGHFCFDVRNLDLGDYESSPTLPDIEVKAKLRDNDDIHSVYFWIVPIPEDAVSLGIEFTKSLSKN